VVGRQGISRKERFLFGSVSSKIVTHASDCTVWVVLNRGSGLKARIELPEKDPNPLRTKVFQSSGR
jgi:hypothetical protein